MEKAGNKDYTSISIVIRKTIPGTRRFHWFSPIVYDTVSFKQKSERLSKLGCFTFVIMKINNSKKLNSEHFSSMLLFHAILIHLIDWNGGRDYIC